MAVGLTLVHFEKWNGLKFWGSNGEMMDEMIFKTAEVEDSVG